jgi:hypothetical protein
MLESNVVVQIFTVPLPVASFKYTTVTYQEVMELKYQPPCIFPPRFMYIQLPNGWTQAPGTSHDGLKKSHWTSSLQVSTESQNH